MSRRAILIGGGITGTLSGLALRRAGWDVVLVEGAHVGAGSSSRTAAGIRQQFSTRETVLGMRYSVDFFVRWAETVGGAGKPIHQNGYLFLYDDAAKWQDAKARVAKQHGWGLTEVEALEQAELGARFSWVDADAHLGATWGPTDGFLRPETVYNEAADALRREGGQLIQQRPVTTARHANGRLSELELADGTVLGGDLFVDCTNAWTRRLGGLLGGTELPVEALKRYLWFVERDAEAMDAETLMSMPLTITPGGAYCRPENPDSLQIGWKHDAVDQSADFDYGDQDIIEPDFFHKSGVDARPFEAWMAIAESLPCIGEFAGITATTAGFYGTSPDHNPFLDFDPQVPNLMRLVGFSGHGAMFGPFTALIAVALAEAGGPLEEVLVRGEHADLRPFKIGRDFGHAEAMVI